MASKSAGLNRTAAKEAYKKVNEYINSLDAHLNALATDIEAMNKNSWYGGSRSIKWYTSANNFYKQDVKFRNAVVQLQSQIKTYLVGINF